MTLFEEVLENTPACAAIAGIVTGAAVGMSLSDKAFNSLMLGFVGSVVFGSSLCFISIVMEKQGKESNKLIALLLILIPAIVFGLDNLLSQMVH